jgi:tetratricopeptide (TPR) repeat protein
VLAGKSAYEKGQYGEAIREYKAALDQAESFGFKDPRFAATLNQLGEVFRAQGRYEEAEPLFRQALTLQEQTFGPRNHQVAKTLNNLAALYTAQGKLAEAEKQCRRAIQIQEALLGPNNASLGASLNNLALLAKSQGRYADAVPLFQRALRIWLEALGADHSLIATSLNNFGTICHTLGRYAEAEALFKHSLNIKERELGSQHPEVATILNNLAELCCAQRRYDEAKLLSRRVLAIDTACWGADHVEVAADLNHLGSIYEAEGNYDEAEHFYQRALAIRQKALPADDPLLAKSIAKLRDLHQAQGRPEPKLETANSKPEIGNSRLGLSDEARSDPLTHHFAVPPLPSRFAGGEGQGVREGRGEQIQQEAPQVPSQSASADLAMASAPRVPGSPALASKQEIDLELDARPDGTVGIHVSDMDSGTPSAAVNLEQLADKYAHAGRLAEAESLYQKALAATGFGPGARSLLAAAALNNLGLIRNAQDQQPDAAKLIQQSLTVWLKLLDPGHVFVAATLNNLATVYRGMEKYGEAEALYNQSLAIAEASSKGNESLKDLILSNLARLRKTENRK